MNLRALEHRTKSCIDKVSVTIDNITKLSPSKGDILVIEQTAADQKFRDQIIDTLRDAPGSKEYILMFVKNSKDIRLIPEDQLHSVGLQRIPNKE